MYITDGDNIFCLSYVCGHPVEKFRKEQWYRMMSMVDSDVYRNKPRLVLGDFNDIKHMGEKEGGSKRSEASFYVFRKMLSICGLHDVRTLGGRFTWVENRYDHTVRTWIDRVTAIVDWLDSYPTANVQMLPWHCSDHIALLLHIDIEPWKRKKLFIYDNRWRINTNVKEEVQRIWNSIGLET